jgi:hypothetical protein
MPLQSQHEWNANRHDLVLHPIPSTPKAIVLSVTLCAGAKGGTGGGQQPTNQLVAAAAVTGRRFSGSCPREHEISRCMLQHRFQARPEEACSHQAHKNAGWTSLQACCCCCHCAAAAAARAAVTNH